MSRVFLSCVTAIALLFTGSIATIAWVTRDLSSDANSSSAALADAAAASAGRVTASPTAAAERTAAAPHDVPGDLGVVPIPPGGAAALRSRATPGKPLHRVGAEMPRSRRAALADLRLDLRAGMAGLRELVAGCPAADASFSLAVESTAGGVRIVNAFVESSAASDDPGIACVQSALRGQLIPASSSIPPGRHWRMPFTVPSST